MPVAIQLAHAGRKGSSRRPWEGGTPLPLAEGGWQPSAPSPIAVGPGGEVPAELDAAGIARIVAAFAASARRALAAGIDAIELHMAHGYLLHEFLSPLSNHRTDAYGGSFDNRIRAPLAVFDAVRAAWPEDRPLGVRVSSVDWMEGGWTLEETVELARLLEARGCDWIDASSGGVSAQQKIALGPGYQVPFARAVRAATGVTTMAVGLITEPQQAEAIIAAGDADLIALARALLWNPRWPWHAAAALGGKVDGPKPYGRALPSGAPRVWSEAPKR
jgi:2,4-dienoyl-CoA reductase-like NADH-dependent reductase (Old Yellow Enzyme family)